MASNRTIAAGEATGDLAIRMGSPNFSITYKTDARDRPLSAIRVRRRRRRSAPGLADGRRLDHAGGTWPRRHPGQQARGRRRHPPRAPSGPGNYGGAPTATPRPRTFCRSAPIRPEDAWCEDPQDRHYNQPIRLVRGQAGDRLTREDHLYDFIVEIDHNTAPRIAGRGSAVFLHLARANFSPTAGCVSMTKSAMLRLLRRMGPETKS